MAINDEWNLKLIQLKRCYPWLRNRRIAKALDVTVDRVNDWTKRRYSMDHAFYELLELKLTSGHLTQNE